MPGDQGDFAEGGAGVKDFFLQMPQSMVQSWFMRLFGGGSKTKLKENLLEAHDRVGNAIEKATEALEKGYVEVSGKKIPLSDGQKRKLRAELEKLNREQKKLVKKLSGKSIAEIEAGPADKDEFDRLFLQRPGVRTKQQQEIDDLVRRQMEDRRKYRRAREGLSESESKIRDTRKTSKDPSGVVGKKRKIKLAGEEKRERLSHRRHRTHTAEVERVRAPEGPSGGVYVKKTKVSRTGEKVTQPSTLRLSTTFHPQVAEPRQSVRKKLLILSKLSNQVEEQRGLRRALAANPKLAVQLKKEFGIEARNVNELAKGLRNILGSRAVPSRDVSLGVTKSLKIVGR